MLSLTNVNDKRIDYGEKSLGQVQPVIVAQQIAALKDEQGAAQDLMLGATGKMHLMVGGEQALDISAQAGKTLVEAMHEQAIELAPADADKTVILGSLTIKESTANQIQLISTALDVGIEINDDVKMQKSLIAANDLVVGGDVFTKSSLNIVRDFQEDANTMQMGYGFRIMDNSNLELYKYNSMSNKTNTVAIFGNGQSTAASGGNFPAFSTGFGAVQLQTNPAWRMDGANISVSGSIVPKTDITYDLGSAQHRFRDLYLSGNTMYIGDTQLSTGNDGSLSVNGEKSASEAMVISLSNAVVDHKADADSNVARIDARINSVLSNTDPVALNSLSEVVAAFQAADGNLNGAITNLASSASGDVASLSNVVASNKTSTDAAIALKAASADLVSLSNEVASNKSSADAAIALKAAAADLVSFSNATTSNLALKAAASDMTIVKAALLNQYLPSASNPSDSNQAKGQAMMQMLMKPMTMYIEGNIAGNYNMTLDASASATALPHALLVSDGAAPVRDATYNSWRYINDAAAALKKINWYFMDNLPALATANLTTTAVTTVMNIGSPFMYSNFKCMYAKVRMNVTSTGPMGGPFFALYTAPTESAWYRSRKNYTF